MNLAPVIGNVATKETVQSLLQDRKFVLEHYRNGEKWNALQDIQVRIDDSFSETVRFTAHFFLLGVLLARQHREEELHRFQRLLKGITQGQIDALTPEEIEELRKRANKAVCLSLCALSGHPVRLVSPTPVWPCVSLHASCAPLLLCAHPVFVCMPPV